MAPLWAATRAVDVRSRTQARSICQRSLAHRLRQDAQREIDREDAAGPGQVTNLEGAVVRFDAALADGQAEPETRPVRSVLQERLKHQVVVARMEAAAA